MSFLSAVKRRPQRYIDVFSEAEVDDLVALPLIDSVLMLALVDAGLRKSEASALQVRRLKVDTGELVVVAGKGGKDRVVPVTALIRTADRKTPAKAEGEARTGFEPVYEALQASA